MRLNNTKKVQHRMKYIYFLSYLREQETKCGKTSNIAINRYKMDSIHVYIDQITKSKTFVIRNIDLIPNVVRVYPRHSRSDLRQEEMLSSTYITLCPY